MLNIVKTVVTGVKKVYRRAGGLLEEERELALSQAFLNGLLKRFVTDKLEPIDDLHAEIYDEWVKLFGSVHYKGIQATLSTNLLVVQLQLEPEAQRIVFEQQGKAQLIDLHADKAWKKMAVNLAIWVFNQVLHTDLLAFILKRLNVITIKHDLLYLDLNRYIGDNKKVMSTLQKVHINHALLRQGQFVIKGNVSLQGLMGQYKDDDADILAPPVVLFDDPLTADLAPEQAALVKAKEVGVL